VTTVVGNPDGGGPVDLKQQAANLEADGGIGVNAALLIGHASVRNAAVRPPTKRDPTAAELDQMRPWCARAWRTARSACRAPFTSRPGTETEVIALAKEAGGVYTSHIRDEGTYDVGVVASVDEVIRIAEEAGVRGIVTHMKALGPDSWGLGTTLVAHIEAARARGVEVYADQYPYDASSTSLAAAVMPGESAAGAREAMAAPDARARFLAIVRDNIRRRGGAHAIAVASGRGAPNLEGQRLDDIAAARGVTPEQAATDIVIAGGASIVSFNMSEKDIETIMRQAWTMASSDGGLSLPGPSLPHPRDSGAFARRLAVYVRERGVISLDHAIRTMTSLPASVFGLDGRGELREGAFADLVVFDPAKVIERATSSSQRARGRHGLGHRQRRHRAQGRRLHRRPRGQGAEEIAVTIRPARAFVVLRPFSRPASWPRARSPRRPPSSGDVEVIRTAHGVPHPRRHLARRGLRHGMGPVRRLLRHADADAAAAGAWRVREVPWTHRHRRQFQGLHNRARAVETYHLLEQETRDIYDGFAAGVHRYIALHADEFPEGMPADFSGYDVASVDIGNGPPAARVRRFVAALTGETPPGAIDTDPAVDADGDVPPTTGSNAWALAPSRTRSGRAILLRNPHPRGRPVTKRT
jgi:N-acyl-D-amino-acid deacylase